MLVLLLFFCSGATALVYEVLWSKYLSWMLGSTVQAQTVVLAVFMGGLAIGNRIFGRRSESFANPLIAYGVIEMIIGLYAFGFRFLYKGADWLFVAGGSSMADVPAFLLTLKLLISLALLLLPTILMGGTLPLMASWIQRRPGMESGARVGVFYATNSLGAVFGAGLAGFFLVQNLGMVSSLEVTALANFLIGIAAAMIGKKERLQVRSAPRFEPEPEPVTTPVESRGWFAMLVGLTGGVSMGLEVLSARALALIAGGSLQAFALVLMSFILGIGLGSMTISSWKVARRFGTNTVYVLLLTAATMVILNVVLIEHWTILYSRAKFGLAANESGYFWHQAAIAGMSFLILGVPAALLGAVVPLSIRLLQGGALALGDQVGRLLTANTIGAVAGVLLTGFVLMPLLGLRAAFAALAMLLIVTTAVVCFRRKQVSAGFGALVLLAVSIAAVAFTGDNWRHTVGAGIYRVRNTHITSSWLAERRKAIEVLYYKDSADATVAVERSFNTNTATSVLSLRINGKTDASTQGDLATQYLLAHIPFMARPEAKRVFVLGFGSGITAGAILGHPVERLTIAENCGPVLEAGHLFAEWNRGVLTNARARIRQDDARAVLKLRNETYDIIISEPSNPWVAGIAGVFSREFYELCASRLEPGGIMAQWFHKYEMNDRIVQMVLRTFSRTFPHMEVWDTQEGDIVLIGSERPWESSPANYQKIFARTEPRKDLAMLGITSGVSMWAKQIASQKTGAAIPGDGPEQTDDFPILEYEAPKAFFIARDSDVLNRFDERTVQFPLSEPAKIAAMRALPEQVLLQSFQFGTSNAEVSRYLNAVMNRATGGLNRIDPMSHSIFRAPDSYPASPAIPPNATPGYAECVRLEAELLRGDSNWRGPVGEIARILTRMIQEQKLSAPDFSPAYYAAVAARFALGAGDYRLAARMIQLGFVFDLENEQLLFLSRVLDRVLPPELLEELGRQDPLKEERDL